MKRKIIEIDEKKCNGCGKCIPNCPEGALQLIDGKARLVSDLFCDGLGACIGEFPELKKYYEKYKDRMEILGIDCRDKEETWRNAVERHRLPWLHVRDEDHPDVSLLYAISVYPTTVVVDPEGRIAKIVQGESPVLYEYLDELFQTED